MVVSSLFLGISLTTAVVSRLYLHSYFLNDIWQLGVAITWSFKFVNHLNLFVLYFTDSLNDVISISRLFDYIQNCPIEKRTEDEKTKDKRINNVLRGTFKEIKSKNIDINERYTSLMRFDRDNIGGMVDP